MLSRALPANRNFRRFFTEIFKKNTASTPVLAFILKPFALQVVVMESVMQKGTGGKKYAKKLKKTLYICREKGQYVPRCLQKAHLKKRWKKPLTDFL
jgi:hypothetical protein